MQKLMSFIILCVVLLSCGDGFTGSRSNNNNNVTLQSSYATLLTVGDFLYAINTNEIVTFDVKDPKNPREIDKQTVGFRIENIFHQSGVLFIGSPQALHIYKIDDNGIPREQSQTNYFDDRDVTPCEPVIVQGNIAFVTLSTSISGRCGRRSRVNELRIYDVSDISKPVLLSQTRLEQPKGLGIDGNYLFVCEEQNGVAVLDVSDRSKPVIIDRLEKFPSYDVIADEGLLMVVCPKEIRQYDYTDIHDIIYLSSIDI